MYIVIIKYINDIRRVLVGERKYHNGMIFKYNNSHEAKAI